MNPFKHVLRWWNIFTCKHNLKRRQLDILSKPSYPVPYTLRDTTPRGLKLPFLMIQYFLHANKSCCSCYETHLCTHSLSNSSLSTNHSEWNWENTALHEQFCQFTAIKRSNRPQFYCPSKLSHGLQAENIRWAMLTDKKEELKPVDCALNQLS